MTDHHDSSDSFGDEARLEMLLREVTPDDRERVAPPDDLWALIADEVEPVAARQRGELRDDRIAAGSDHRFDDAADVVVLDHRRSSRRSAALLGAAAAVLLVVGGFVFVARRGDDGSTVLANGRLGYDASEFDALGADAAASVSLVDDGGTLHIELDESELPDPAGEAADLELWLIESDADGNPVDLVSLGIIDPDAADAGDFVVPEAYDPEVYSVVDISIEPRDGNPDHSGRSILRGPLVGV